MHRVKRGLGQKEARDAARKLATYAPKVQRNAWQTIIGANLQVPGRAFQVFHRADQLIKKCLGANAELLWSITWLQDLTGPHASSIRPRIDYEHPKVRPVLDRPTKTGKENHMVGTVRIDPKKLVAATKIIENTLRRPANETREAVARSVHKHGVNSSLQDLIELRHCSALNFLGEEVLVGVPDNDCSEEEASDALEDRPNL